MTRLTHKLAVARLGGLLEGLSGEIEALGEALCADPAVAAGHGGALQAIDLIGQQQRALAALMQAGCMHCAARAIGIDSLRDRITALGIGSGCGHRS